MYAQSGSGLEKRRLALDIFGSNLSLDGQKLVGRATKPWNALVVSDRPVELEYMVAAVRTAFGIAEPVDAGHASHGTMAPVTPGS